MFIECITGAVQGTCAPVVHTQQSRQNHIMDLNDSTSLAELMARYQSTETGHGVPKDGWRICLAHEFKEKRKPLQGKDVSISYIVKHIGFGLR